MSERFFVEPSIGDLPRVSLQGPEAHHLAKVMRAKLGDEVTLFDGSGEEFVAQVATIAKSSVELEIVSRVVVNRELDHALTAAVALPKGDRQKFLVEKLVELGVTCLIPLETHRGVAQPVASAMERLRQQVIEASKQCRRNRLMTIGEPSSIKSLTARTSELGVCVLAHPSGETFPSTSNAAPSLFAVGPEGGFTDDEVTVAREAGWSIVSLGPRILRVETAALALAVMCCRQP